jgi:hypothetical protein
MRLLILLLLAEARFRTPLSAQQIVVESSCGGATKLGIVVPAEQPELLDLKSISRNILKAHSADRLVYAVFGSTAEAVQKGLWRTHIGSDDETEIVARAIQNSKSAIGSGGGPVAALVRLDGDAVLVFSGETKPAERVQLQGTRDPTAFHLSGAGYSIVHIDVAYPAPQLPMPRACRLTVYVKAGKEPSSADGSALQGRFQQMFPNAQVAILARSDGWFLDNEDYPDVPLLLNPLVIPEMRPWLLARRINCSSPGWPSSLAPQCISLDPSRLQHK